MSTTEQRILIVDDSPEDRATFRRYLTQALRRGDEIREAELGQDGLAVCAEWQPDCVLVDYRMPDLDGLEFLRRLNHDHECGAVLMVTGEGDEDVAVEAMKLGALDYLVKSRIDRESLLRAVRYALEQKESRDQRREAQERLQLITEQSSSLLWTTDLDGRFTAPPPFGLLRDPAQAHELLGTTLFDYFKTHDATFPTIAGYQRALHGDTTSMDFHWQGRDLHLRTQPFRDSRSAIVGTLGIGLDVTAQMRMERQMDAARQIQRKLLPQTAPQLAGFDIAGAMFPAYHTAGDYFDFIPMAEDILGVVVGDVSGKGLGAALIMVELRAYLRSQVENIMDIPELLRRASRFLLQDFKATDFVTLFFGWLDSSRNCISYVGAGHNGFLLKAAGEIVELPGTTQPLGLFETPDHAAVEIIPLEPGDVLLVLTDGFNETLGRGELLGMACVLETAQRVRERSAEQILKALHQLARDFADGASQYDDMTGVVIKCLQPA